jgi:exosortase
VAATRTALVRSIASISPSDAAPAAAASIAFAVLFWLPLTTLIRDWLANPEAGHGLLLGPLSVWLAWRRGWLAPARGQAASGLLLVGGAVALRYLSGLAAELFTMRAALLGAGCGLVVFYGGWRQLRHWWLPTSLLALSIPLPAVVLASLALPLQLKASQLGAALLQLRDVPVRLSGNVIHLPGQSLFVTEACSGLRSLSALLALGLLIGALWLRTAPGRAVIVLAAIPVAVLVNGVRIFGTGFSAYFVSPSLATGFMHYSEGWAMFVVAFAVLGLLAWGVARGEAAFAARTAP